MGWYVSTARRGIERRLNPSRELPVQVRNVFQRASYSTRGPLTLDQLVRKSRLTPFLDIVNPQRFEIANVQPAVRNHRIRKRFLRHLPRLFLVGRIRRREASSFAIAFGSGLHQHASSTLVVNV